MSFRKGTWDVGNVIRSRAERFLLWLEGRQQQHYGPKARIPELFQRRDHPWLVIQAGKVRMQAPQPAFFHDLLDAAAKVGALEERLGYTFKNRITCIEALKLTGSTHSLYYGGLIRHASQNNRLALLGDRVLSLAVCEIWFQTEHSTKEHSDMSSATVSRAALATTGYALRLQESILTYRNATVIRDHIAETFEAVLGAIYVDSGYSIPAVKNVIRKLGLDNHKYLKTREEFAIEERDRIAIQAATAQVQRLLDEQTAPDDRPASVDDQPAPVKLASSAQDKVSLAKTSIDDGNDHPASTRHGSNTQIEHRQSDVCMGDTTIPETHNESISDADIEAVKRGLLHMTSRSRKAGLRKDLDILNRILKKPSSEQVEIAKLALRESFILREQGKRTGPLKIFHRMRAEMGKAKDRERNEALQKVQEAREQAFQPRNEVTATSMTKATTVQDRVQVARSSVAISGTTDIRAAVQKESPTTIQGVDGMELRKHVEAAGKKAKGLKEREKDTVQSHRGAWSPSRSGIVELPRTSMSTPVPASSRSEPEFFESEIDLGGFMDAETSEHQREAPPKDARPSANADKNLDESPQVQSNVLSVAREWLERREGWRGLEATLNKIDQDLGVMTRTVGNINLETKLRPIILKDIRLKVAEMTANNSRQHDQENQVRKDGTSESPDDAKPTDDKQQRKMLHNNELIRPSEAPKLLMRRIDVRDAFSIAKAVTADHGIKPREPGWKMVIREALEETASTATELTDQQRSDNTDTTSCLSGPGNDDTAGVDQAAQRLQTALAANEVTNGRKQASDGMEATELDEVTVLSDIIVPAVHDSTASAKEEPRFRIRKLASSSTSQAILNHDSMASAEEESRFQPLKPQPPSKRRFPMWVFTKDDEKMHNVAASTSKSELQDENDNEGKALYLATHPEASGASVEETSSASPAIVPEQKSSRLLEPWTQQVSESTQVSTHTQPIDGLSEAPSSSLPNAPLAILRKQNPSSQPENSAGQLPEPLPVPLNTRSTAKPPETSSTSVEATSPVPLPGPSLACTSETYHQHRSQSQLLHSF